MKRISLISIFTFIILSLSSQDLIDIYKSGPVELIPDKSYATGNDWDKVFETYWDTLYGQPMGNRKSLQVLPDGRVVVNHTYRNFYTMFNPDGSFEKEFGVKNSKGKRFQKTEKIVGVLDNNIFVSALDNVGNMVCFDLDGNYDKTLKLDYMARQVVTLPGNRIALVGWVIWSDRFRDFVAIADYETNEQKIIWDQFTDRCATNDRCKLFNYSYNFKEKGSISFTTMPWQKSTGMTSPPRIAAIGNNLVVALPPTGEIMVYDLEGNLISRNKINWAQNYVSVEEQREIQQKAIDRYKNADDHKMAEWVSLEESRAAKEELVRQMEADLTKISKPIPIPTFSTIIRDSDDNLLFFEFPKEEDANKFNVWIYDGSGSFVCESSFVCDEYDLWVSPSKMVFHNGYIYALQLKKDATGVPLRLVRFKVSGDS